MANIRLALLFAVALVAIISPVMESSFLDLLKGSTELRNKLALNVLETSEIRSILKSLYFNDRDAKIGEMKVIRILNKNKEFSLREDKKDILIFGEQRHNTFTDLDCSRDAILAHFKDVMSSNLNTVLNVCKFVNPEWMSYCEYNIKQVYKDEQQLRQMGTKALAPGQVSEILDSIGDKRNAKFKQTSVESLLHQSPPFKVEDCLPDAINARESYLRHPNPILVSNLQNFDKALDLLFPFCAQNIRKVFEISTANIADEVKERIKAALPRESASDWLKDIKWGTYDSHVKTKIHRDGIANSCREVGKSVANVKYIKLRVETSLSESLDTLLGDEWVELERDCFYYFSCYVYPVVRKSKFCDEKPNNVQFLQIRPGAVQWKYHESGAENRA